MSSPGLHSFLADSIHQFVNYKRALNRKYRCEAAALRLFDRYISEHGLTGWDATNSIVIECFLQSRPRTRPRSYNHLLGVLHRFFDWAVMQKFITSNPVMATPRRNTGKRIPYLFDINDAKRLLEVVRTFPNRSRAPHRALTYETVFALLYGLGLRVGEVARLRLGDVDFQRDILFIRETKFSKNRIVPMGPKLAARLHSYVDERYGETYDAGTPLFSFTKRGCVCEETISQTFHALVPRLGLRLAPGVSSPRVHDLRHAFAVGTLLRWYREGVDPNRRLIHLSTFLGHVDPNSTAVYLTITGELLREADRRFRAFAPTGGTR
ncbi:MAG: tyrosine-type recombinase/integrase [Acidobacteriia bacterium]|nr:tyrosine-type recombinase/integrase [Terriglobia bacterium]